MCKTLTEGGKRCAAHTRPRYEAAQFGTAEWDRSAAEYAATPSGNRALRVERAEAEAAADLERTIALDHAITEGRHIAATAQAVRDALTSNAASTAERFAGVEDSLRGISDGLGYHRMVNRTDGDPSRPFMGTLVFQQGTRSVEVPYTVHTEGFTVHLNYSDLHPDHGPDSISQHDVRARWGHAAGMDDLTAKVRAVLEHRRDTSNGTSSNPSPATPAELEAAFTAVGENLGCSRVRISDIPDSPSKYVNFMFPGKGRRMRYYTTPNGWTARIRGYHPRFTGPNARQTDTDLQVSAMWENEADNHAALAVIRDVFNSLR